jgi:hypothetical protein
MRRPDEVRAFLRSDERKMSRGEECYTSRQQQLARRPGGAQVARSSLVPRLSTDVNALTVSHAGSHRAKTLMAKSLTPTKTLPANY